MWPQLKTGVQSANGDGADDAACDAACLAMPLALRCRLPCDAADDVPIGREISHRICTFGGEFAYLMASLPI
ncbi:MAG: hypothetical protein ACK6DS_05760 [Planctomycetota bacterium]